MTIAIYIAQIIIVENTATQVNSCNHEKYKAYLLMPVGVLSLLCLPSWIYFDVQQQMENKILE